MTSTATTEKVCAHSRVTLEPSNYAAEAGFQWTSVQKRAAAVTTQGRAPPVPSVPAITVFPAPLVLPDDELALDPKYPAQSLRSWIRSKDRNHISQERGIIYVAQPPSLDPSVDGIRSWTQPGSFKASSAIEPPDTQEVVDYLAAFYHGVPVKKLPAQLAYTSWDEGDSQRSRARAKTKDRLTHIGLNIGTECVRIRSRVSKNSDGLFSRQLNLDDLLDAAISLLPNDAYALLLLVSHDIYENDDDDFACGRAYGGSRVAVVSTARYNPAIDEQQNVNREHAWPASHCEEYVRQCTSEPPKKKRKAKNDLQARDPRTGPMYAALEAHCGLPSHLSPSTLSGLWLARVCRTASHELGHCFGLDHCVYYACAMQGTASLAEDATVYLPR
ncbi:hypothetical protein GYMLUDRAFT_34357 [Collybiopsis luxurians FD-317 M1]|nr:hypothetical protein GYMLUDRAFT_34357 [Collybiopsis luxurians FD-317 M1]